MIIWLLILTPFLRFVDDSKKIEGLWYAEHMQSVILIQSVGKNSWEGVIKEAEKSEWIGKVLISLTNYDEKKQEWIGVLVLPKTGMTISSTLHIKDDETLEIVGKKFFITKTYEWKRAKEQKSTNE
ncbi:DUF2147 domain-containing protein [bacterium]|nr:MAG: DUF2147 domain-containing protein [bacterium]